MFKIVTACYKCEKWIQELITSLKSQDYPHFESIIIDDCSTDCTRFVIDEYVAGDERFTVITNPTRLGSMRNIQYGVNTLGVNKEDIIIVLDGDDWLATPDVLSYIKSVYEETQCWMTYGNCLKTSSMSCFSDLEYPDEVLQKGLFREDQWRAVHLRTFKYGLWQLIDQNDFLDRDGKYFSCATDLAFLFPMLEMACDKVQYINRILHIFNDTHDNSEATVDDNAVLAVEWETRNKQRYEKIESYC